MERFAAKHAGESGRGSEEDAQPSGAADAAELSLSGMTHAATDVLKAREHGLFQNVTDPVCKYRGSHLQIAKLVQAQ